MTKSCVLVKNQCQNCDIFAKKVGIMRHLWQTTRYGAYWLVWASAVGILAGVVSAIFLVLLESATQFRTANPDLIFALPIVGFGIVWVYHHYGNDARLGNAFIITQIHQEVHADTRRVPLRMTPFILLGTVFTHLVGGSAGREGTAVQMGASLADMLGRMGRIAPDNRHLLLMCGVSAGFGAVFGTPIAGFVFGLEVPSAGKLRYEGALPCLIGALVGDLTVRFFGVAHTHYPQLPTLALDALLLAKVALVGVAFGLASILFIILLEWVKRQQSTLVYPPFRAVIGGLIVIVLTILVGNQDYNGLSIPLIKASVNGESVFVGAFLLKIVFTAITLGSGFVGGEVTPLFVIGATLGASLGGLLGIEPSLCASLGFVAVFAGASNTPLACALMGVELFGSGALPYLILACFVAYLISGKRSIYSTQRLDAKQG
jgi:H+/Cl- antiporter ClcA